MEIIRLVQTIHNPFLDNLFIGITMLGEEYFPMLLLVVVYWCLDKRFAYKMGFAFLLSNVVNQCLKGLFKVPRPIGKEGIRSLRLETATGYSFPSGHTQSAAAISTALMLQLKKRWIYIAGTVLTLLVGLSRIYLGVHTPYDVIGGLLAGVLIVIASNWCFEKIDKSNKHWILLVLIIPLAAAALLTGSEDGCKAAGIAAGFAAGYLIELKYISFKTEGALHKQLLKLFIGLAVLILIRTCLKLILPQTLASDFIRYLLMGLWVTVGAPAIFRKLFGYNTPEVENQA